MPPSTQPTTANAKGQDDVQGQVFRHVELQVGAGQLALDALAKPAPHQRPVEQLADGAGALARAPRPARQNLSRLRDLAQAVLHRGAPPAKQHVGAR